MEKYKKVFLSISKLYKVNLLITTNFKYKASYLFKTQTIEISNQLFKSNSFFKEEYLIYAFLHELSHHIQNQFYSKLRLKITRSIPYLYYLYEKQADKIAYNLYKNNFSNLFKIFIDKNFFLGYNSYEIFKNTYKKG